MRSVRSEVRLSVYSETRDGAHDQDVQYILKVSSGGGTAWSAIEKENSEMKDERAEARCHDEAWWTEQRSHRTLNNRLSQKEPSSDDKPRAVIHRQAGAFQTRR